MPDRTLLISRGGFHVTLLLWKPLSLHAPAAPASSLKSPCFRPGKRGREIVSVGRASLCYVVQFMTTLWEEDLWPQERWWMDAGRANNYLSNYTREAGARALGQF